MVEHLALAQVVIPGFLGSSPTSGSLRGAQGVQFTLSFMEWIVLFHQEVWFHGRDLPPLAGAMLKLHIEEGQ